MSKNGTPVTFKINVNKENIEFSSSIRLRSINLKLGCAEFLMEPIMDREIKALSCSIILRYIVALQSIKCCIINRLVQFF